ncbi:MAG: hypothetical protein ACP5IL_07385 [Syntrophobacteraceae bacterium]
MKKAASFFTLLLVAATIWITPMVSASAHYHHGYYHYGHRWHARPWYHHHWHYRRYRHHHYYYYY